MQRKEGCRITGIASLRLYGWIRLSTSSASKEAARLLRGGQKRPGIQAAALIVCQRETLLPICKKLRERRTEGTADLFQRRKRRRHALFIPRAVGLAAAPSVRQADIRSSRVPRGFDQSSREYLSHNHHLRYFVSYTLKNRCMLIALSYDLLRQYLPRAEQRRCGRERVVRDGADAGADV